MGIAILDTRGNVLDTTSKKNFNRKDIVEYISRFGIPLVIASDVNPLPKIVKKIAHSFGTGVYYPEVSLQNRKKHLIVKKYLENVKSHEKDALAAGIKAYKSYRQLFARVEEILEKRGMEEKFDDVVAKILRGKSSNIEEAIRRTS